MPNEQAPGPPAAESPPVSLESISKAPVEVPNAGGDTQSQREREQLAHKHAQFKKELGWLGLPFGGRREKPGNISALVIICCFFAMYLVYTQPPAQSLGVSFERLFGGLTSIVTLILGYLFGSNERHSGKEDE